MHQPVSTYLSYAFVYLAILHACSSISFTVGNCFLAFSIFIMGSFEANQMRKYHAPAHTPPLHAYLATCMTRTVYTAYAPHCLTCLCS